MNKMKALFQNQRGLALVGILSSVLLCGMLSGGALVTYSFLTLPKLKNVKRLYPHVAYASNRPRIEFRKFKPVSWSSYQQISPDAINAIVVSEDWGFYHHKGVDPIEIKEAVKEVFTRGRFRGASTITQQLARNLYLTKEKNIIRKIREMFLAVQLEQKLSKQQILERYLNVIEFGPGVYGIKAAARYYFRKYPSQINAKEGAFLAMLLPSPRKYSQSFRSKKLSPYAKRTVRSILRKMERKGYLSAEEKEFELDRQLDFESDFRI